MTEFRSLELGEWYTIERADLERVRKTDSHVLRLTHKIPIRVVVDSIPIFLEILSNGTRLCCKSSSFFCVH